MQMYPAASVHMYLDLDLIPAMQTRLQLTNS